MPLDESAAKLSNRVLVVRLGAMGDIIHGLPAIAALRRARPDLQLGWLVEERWEDLLCARPSERTSARSELKPVVDWVHVSNFAEWRKSLGSRVTWNAMQACREEVVAMKYGMTLDLQGAIRSAFAASLSGASLRIGPAQPREGPARFFYTRAVSPQGDHVIEQGLWLASAVAGEPLGGAEAVFPRDPEDDAWAAALHSSLGGKDLAILNPGAGWGAKCWPAESYGKVARALAERGMVALVNHGPQEQPLAEAVRRASQGVARALNCTVGQLIALTRRASLFVGGDTGPMHLAAALEVPVVALFGPTRPERNGPYTQRAVVLRSPESVDNTSHTQQPDKGLQSIEAQAVLDAVERLLETRHA